LPKHGKNPDPGLLKWPLAGQGIGLAIAQQVDNILLDVHLDPPLAAGE